MVKLIDVAKAARMNPSTVSRALNDSSKINEDTKDYIRFIANELGYKPNNIARALTGKGIKTIGMIVPELYSDHFAQLIDQIARLAKHAGYSLIISITHFNSEEEFECINSMREHRVDGFIFAHPYNTDTAVHLSDFQRSSNVPFVLIQSPPDDLFNQFDRVDVADNVGYEKMLNWLHDRGIREITWIGDFRSSGTFRLNQCKIAAEKFNISLDEQHIICEDKMLEPCGYQCMNRVMQMPNFPKAIIAAYDYLAIGAIKAAADHDVSLLNQLTFCGYDGIRELNYFPHKIYSITPSYSKIAQCSVDLLMKRIDHKRKNPELIVLEPQFIDY